MIANPREIEMNVLLRLEMYAGERIQPPHSRIGMDFYTRLSNLIEEFKCDQLATSPSTA